MTIILIFLFIYIFFQRGNLLTLWARYVYHNKNADRGLTLYGLAYRIGGVSAVNRINYAYFLLRAGRLDECNKVLERELNKAKKKHIIVSAKSTLALLLWKQEDIDGAINALEEVLSNGENSVAYGSLGYMYILKGGSLRTALDFCKKAYEYNPNDNIIMDNYATVLYKTGSLEQAKEIYVDLVERRPTFPEAYYNYGHLLIDQGNISDGVSMLKKALNSKYTFLTTLSPEAIEEEIDNYEGQA